MEVGYVPPNTVSLVQPPDQSCKGRFGLITQDSMGKIRTVHARKENLSRENIMDVGQDHTLIMLLLF